MQAKTILPFKTTFVLLAVLFTLFIFTLSGNVIDIQLHDIYFVIGKLHLWIPVAFYSVFCFGVYQWLVYLEYQTIGALNGLHLLFFALFLLFLFIVTAFLG